MEKLTKLEIINETISFYTGDTKRRSLNDKGYCVYNGPNGAHCAVGRCLLPEYKEMGESLPMNEEAIRDLFEARDCNSIDDMLEEKYRGHDLSFWNQLQLLHDGEEYWDASGFTTEGEKKANMIINMFNLKLIYL